MQTDHEYHALSVLDVVEETADSRSFVLEVPSELGNTFAYAAGQFCTFRAEIGGESVVRCYSMSSSPDTGDRLTTTVKRVPDGVMSNWMIDELSTGDSIEVMPPSGRFVLRESEAPIVAFAGGSGITPIISIIKTALATTKRELSLIYANRSRDDVIFRDDLDRLRDESGGRLSIHHHLDTEGGYLDADACVALVGGRAGADFYVCGPGPYMETVEAGLEKLDVAPSQLFIERFVAPGDDPSINERSATESVVFKLKSRKHSVGYQLGDSLLETARRGDLKPPFSCETGSCGSCMAHLVSGSATMRVNNALTPDEVEEGWVLTCQAVPTSREVVVDYDA